MERRARAGDWIGVFGSRTSVVLPPDRREHAARVWPLTDVGADHVAVLDALLADGLEALPDFVVVESDDDRTRVVVRGAAEVLAHTLEGRVRVRAGDRIWEEDAFVGLVALEVVLPSGRAAHDEPETAVRPGIARVGGVTWGQVPTAPPASPPGPVLSAVPTPGEDDVPEDRAGSAPGSGAVHLVPPVITPVVPPASQPLPPTPSLPPLPPIPPTPSVPPAPPAPPAPPVPPAPRSVPEEPETAPISSTPWVPSWQEEVTSRLPAEEEGGLAALGFGVDDPEPETTGRSGGHVVAELFFSHGVVVPVDGVVLVGRSPAPRPGSAGARLVGVPSPHQEVSSTHVEIRPGDGLELGTAVVTDLGSTNGTLVVLPGQAARELRPGEPQALPPGAVVDLGDGATIEVRRP